MKFLWPLIFGVALCVHAQGRDRLSLGEALQRGLEYNLNLQRDRLGLFLSKEDVVIAEAVWDPVLRVNYSYRDQLSAQASSVLDGASQPQSTNQNYGVSWVKEMSSGGAVTVSGSQSRSTTNSSNALLNPNYYSDLGVQWRQPLLQGAGTKVNLAPIARAKLREKQSLSTWQTTVVNWMGDLEKAYWSVAAQQSLLEVRQVGLVLAERLLEETRERHELGLGTDVALLQAEAEKAREEEALWVAQAVLQDLLDDLYVLMGEETLRGQSEEAPVLDDLPDRLEGLPDYSDYWFRVLQKNGDLQEREWDLELAELSLLQARNAALPSVDWVLGYNWLGRDDELARSFDNALDRDGRNWNTGLTLNLPWGRVAGKASVRKAQWQKDQADYDLRLSQRNLEERARQLWRSLDLVRKRVTSAQVQLALREKAYEQAEARYQSGLETFRDVLTAQRELQAARNSRVQLWVDQMATLVELQELDRSLLERHGYTWDDVSK